MHQAAPHTEILQAQALQGGDRHAFDYFFTRYYPALGHFAHQLLTDQYTAEELADEAFVKLWQRHHRYDTPGAIRSFLYTTVRNAALNHLRQQKKRLTASLDLAQIHLEDDSPNIEHLIIRSETINRLHLGLQSLPVKCRQVATLYFLEEKSYEEIAHLLNLSINNVRNHKARALQLLRGTLGNSLAWMATLLLPALQALASLPL